MRLGWNYNDRILIVRIAVGYFFIFRKSGGGWSQTYMKPVPEARAFARVSFKLRWRG